MDASVADTVSKVESLGAEQYKTFVEERLEQRTKPVTDTLPKNNMSLFSHPPVKTQSMQKMQIEALNSDCHLFSWLYVLAKYVMAIWINSSATKTRQRHHLCLWKGRCDSV